MKIKKYYWYCTLVAILFLVIGTPASAASPIIVGFTANQTSGSSPFSVGFTDQTSGSLPTGWAWYFGDESYSQAWTSATAPWMSRQHHSAVVTTNGGIVLMGGQTSSTRYRNDTWKSTNNGVTWTQANASSGWSERRYLESSAMTDGSIILTGGINNSSVSYNDTWLSTDDGSTWSLMNASSGWGARYGHSTVALPDGSIVLIAGSTITGSMQDVWRSTDSGLTWTQVNASAFGGNSRRHLASVALSDGTIVVTGGSGGTDLYNDTWRSSNNGVTWTLVNASGRWAIRDRHAMVAMPDDSILLMGGLNQTSTTYYNDTWRSTDKGATWTRLDANAEWEARNGFPSVVAPNGSIVLMGGNLESGGGVPSQDIWRLNPVGSSAQNPSHTYSLSGTYKVALQAYNTGGYNKTLKAGYITVTGPLAPVASFTVNTTSGTAPRGVIFTDTSSNAPTAWNWSFRNVTGNNTQVWFSTVQSPTHTFGLGNYSIVLNASNSAGFNLSTQVTFINVTAAPVVTNVTSKIGIFRPSSGIWSLDSNGNNIWEPSDVSLSWGLPNDTPVIGDWNGDAKSDIGIFRSSSGIWSLDSNGNNIWEPSDVSLSWGLPNDTPVIGDWNGDAKSDIGIFRPSSGIWSLDSNGNNIWEPSDVSLSWGLPNDTPVIGDWNGDAKSDIGIFRSSSGIWSLDSNGNNIWEPSDVSLSWGLPNDTPAVGKY